MFCIPVGDKSPRLLCLNWVCVAALLTWSLCWLRRRHTHWSSGRMLCSKPETLDQWLLPGIGGMWTVLELGPHRGLLAANRFHLGRPNGIRHYKKEKNKLCTIDFYYDFNFVFWVLENKKTKNICEMSYSLLSMKLLKCLKWYKKRKNDNKKT